MPARPSRKIKLALWTSAAAFLALSLAFALDTLGVAPRELALYVEYRVADQSPAIAGIAAWAAQTLRRLERGDLQALDLVALRVGAQNSVEPAKANFRKSVVPVKSAPEARAAIARAQPGDIITFSPGTYRFTGGGPYIQAARPGAPGRAITVRAERPGTVLLEMELAEGFLVTAPYWTFENLSMRGVCGEHSTCEHAFHVVGQAAHFTARNNTVLDYNAHFKINGDGKHVPDHGLIEGNTLSNSSVRKTANPVTPIDLVAASHWTIRRNLISDFVKGGGDQISYGAFVKGGGEDNRLEQNVVVCESRLRGAPGQRVGLSLGGGGTASENCRERRCITEQQASTMQANLIVSCSDDGIYVNRAADSSIRHNTLIDTGPIVVRFPESSADVEGNLVDSGIQSRDGGVLRASENRQTRMAYLYLGLHPARWLFADAGAFDFTWAGSPPRRRSDGPPVPELCGEPRPPRAAFGAFEDFSRCWRQAKAL